MGEKRLVGRLVARQHELRKAQKNHLHFGPLALENFILIGGMRLHPRVPGTLLEGKTHLVCVLGNALDTPNRPLQTAIPSPHGHPPSTRTGTKKRSTEDQRGSFPHPPPTSFGSSSASTPYTTRMICAEVCFWLCAAYIILSAAIPKGVLSGTGASHQRHMAVP